MISGGTSPRDYMVSSEWGLPPQFESRCAAWWLSQSRTRDHERHEVVVTTPSN
jgi:hypothetical protein